MWLLRSSPWNIRDSPSAHASSPSVSPSSSTVCSGRSLPWEIVACESSTGEATLVTREAVVASSSVLHCRCTTSQAPDVVELADIERLALELVPYVVVMVCILYTLRLLYRVRRDITTHSSAPKRWRCATIDTFRGVTLCMMIFVNYGGGGMAVFQHSAWDGMTAADVVFPWFAWIMGFTMRLGASNGNKVIGSVSKVLTRCLKLFLLGLFLNNGRNWAEWRIPGVLQALGTAYLICFSSARLVDCLMARRSSQASGLPLVATHSIVAIAPLVLINLFVTFLLPVPGCPTGYIGPGGDSDGGAHRNCTGGAHLYLDRLMFGETHIFQTPTCKAVFHTGPFDPEGVLNWLMIAVTAYLGYIAGIMYSTGRSKLKTQVLAGAILFLAAALVSGGFGVVERGIPLNKNLWSLSYVLMSSALAHFAFALLHFFGDDEFARSSFAFVGRNPIFLYVMHEVLQSYVPFSVKPSAEVGPSSALLLLHNVAGVLWWIFMAEWLHARGIYMSV